LRKSEKNFSFKCYILPIIEYSSALWVFKLRDGRHFHFSTPLVRPYISIFGELNRFYLRCARSILGVPVSSSGIATLVRLGWMPLDYHLAFRACIWFLRDRAGLCGTALNDHIWGTYNNRTDFEAWSNTCFYKHCLDFILRLNSYQLGPDLLNIDVKRAPKLLKKCIFHELNGQWAARNECQIGHVVHPVWDTCYWGRDNYTKFANHLYHSCALGRVKTRARLHRLGRAESSCCRFGCSEDEDIKHLLFDCPHTRALRDTLDQRCRRIGISFTLRNLLTDHRIQIDIEKFLHTVLC